MSHQRSRGQARSISSTVFALPRGSVKPYQEQNDDSELPAYLTKSRIEILRKIARPHRDLAVDTLGGERFQVRKLTPDGRGTSIVLRSADFLRVRNFIADYRGTP